MRIGTKSFLGLSLKQVGLRFIHPLRVSSPPFSRLIRLYSSPSTSLPLCAPNSFGEFLMILYILCSVSDYLLCRSVWESPRNTSIVYFWCFSSDAKIGRHLGGKSSCRAWARRHRLPTIIICLRRWSKSQMHQKSHWHVHKFNQGHTITPLSRNLFQIHLI